MRRARGLTAVALLSALVGAPAPARALPSGPRVFCQTYATSPLCRAGVPACSLCHTSPPGRNVYGAAVEANLLAGRPRPISDADFAAALPAALAAIDAADSDGDGATNHDEIVAGTFPADDTSHPDPGGCASTLPNPYYGVCTYDRVFAYRKLLVDFCGQSPTFEQLGMFRARDAAGQEAELDAALDRCLVSEHWLGRDGVLWRMAYKKVRPIQALKSGEGEGLFPLGDYFDDFDYFVYASTGDRDVRDLLLGQYYVTRSASTPTTYTRVEDLPQHFVPRERRAGMLTQRWFLVYFIMFSPLQRTMASQAYRAYLGLDLARLEGMYPVPNEPADYDDRGVAAPGCAGCHSTIDPLTYPFRDYDGLIGRPLGAYTPNRLTTLFTSGPSTLRNVPERGSIFGQPVANLREWVEVAANSDAFAAAVVADYWTLLVGEPPQPSDQAYAGLWRALRGADAYNVRAMLHRLIRTDVYGVP